MNIKIFILRLGLFIACYSHFLAGEKLKDQIISEANYSNQSAELENSKRDLSSANNSKKGNKKKTIALDAIGSNDSYESRSRNSHLRDIYLDLAPLYFTNDDQRGDLISMDGFLLYIFGVVVKNLHKEDGLPFYGNYSKDEMKSGYSTPNARQIFLESLRIYPWNWY